MRLTRLHEALLRTFAAAALVAFAASNSYGDEELEFAPSPDDLEAEVIPGIDPLRTPVRRVSQVSPSASGEDIANQPLPNQKVTCPSIEEMRSGLKPISALGVDIAPRDPMMPLPPDCAAELLNARGNEPVMADLPRGWTELGFAWEAPGLRHYPLYFEDAPLERYGQTVSPLLQPVISAARFYGSIPLLPYKMALNPPCEHIFALGYYRPGSCAPFVRQRLPIQANAIALQGAAVTAFIFFIP